MKPRKWALPVGRPNSLPARRAYGTAVLTQDTEPTFQPVSLPSSGVRTGLLSSLFQAHPFLDRISAFCHCLFRPAMHPAATVAGSPHERTFPTAGNLTMEDAWGRLILASRAAHGARQPATETARWLRPQGQMWRQTEVAKAVSSAPP